MNLKKYKGVMFMDYSFLSNKEFVPSNRYILLEEVEENEKKMEEDDEPLLCVPKSKVCPKNNAKLYKIKSVSIDCSRNLRDVGRGKYVVVEDSMVEEFSYGDKKYKIVLENHCYGVFL